MRYRPDLDGLRAIAVLAVMASHTRVSYTYGGWMGVDVFFVLSGFLITTLLVAERERVGRVSLRRFYGRRALRLYPALVAMILFVGFWFAVGAGYGAPADYWRTAIRSALYLENVAAGAGHPGLLPHTWSLAVEEQFYVLWPPVLVFLLWTKRDPLPWAFLGVSVSWALGVLYMTHGLAGYSPAYYLPWSRFGQLLLGGMLALAIARGVKAPAFIRSAGGGLFLVVSAIGLVYIAHEKLRIPNLSWEAPAIALIAAGVVWHLTCNETSPVRRLLEARPLNWLGRRSYGIYLIHLPVWSLLEVHLHAARVVVFGFMAAISLALAALSYRFVEMPFLQRKARLTVGEELDHAAAPLRPRADASHAAPAQAGVSA